MLKQYQNIEDLLIQKEDELYLPSSKIQFIYRNNFKINVRENKINNFIKEANNFLYNNKKSNQDSIKEKILELYITLFSIFSMVEPMLQLDLNINNKINFGNIINKNPYLMNINLDNKKIPIFNLIFYDNNFNNKLKEGYEPLLENKELSNKFKPTCNLTKNVQENLFFIVSKLIKKNQNLYEFNENNYTNKLHLDFVSYAHTIVPLFEIKLGNLERQVDETSLILENEIGNYYIKIPKFLL